MVHKYKIADVVVSVDFIYAYSPHICSRWEVFDNQTPELELRITNQEVEWQLSQAPDLPPPYAESLVFFRKVNDFLLENKNATVFHCSAIAVDGKGYLFTAPSGTGKSTHAKLWRQLLGDKALMINDDKPIVREVDGQFFVYGTPWQGKHDLGENTKAKISAVCLITRDNQPRVVKIPPNEFIKTLLNQTVRPQNSVQLDKLLGLMERLANSVDLYQIYCNTDICSAQVAYSQIVKESL